MVENQILKITFTAYRKMLLLSEYVAETYDKETTWFLVCEEGKNGFGITITDIVIPEQKISSVECEVKIGSTFSVEGLPLKLVPKIKGFGHSHKSLGCEFSAKDTETLENWAYCRNYAIGVVVSLPSEIKAYIQYGKPLLTEKLECDLKIITDTEDKIKEDLVKVIEAKIVKPKEKPKTEQTAIATTPHYANFDYSNQQAYYNVDPNPDKSNICERTGCQHNLYDKQKLKVCRLYPFYYRNCTARQSTIAQTSVKDTKWCRDPERAKKPPLCVCLTLNNTCTRSIVEPCPYNIHWTFKDDNLNAKYSKPQKEGKIILATCEQLMIQGEKGKIYQYTKAKKKHKKKALKGELLLLCKKTKTTPECAECMRKNNNKEKEQPCDIKICADNNKKGYCRLDKEQYDKCQQLLKGQKKELEKPKEEEPKTSNFLSCENCHSSGNNCMTCEYYHRLMGVYGF